VEPRGGPVQGGFRANETLAEREGQQRLVLLWYRFYRRSGILGTFALSIDHLLGRLSRDRADGALVRLSTPLEEGGSSPPGAAWPGSPESSTPRSTGTGQPSCRSEEARDRSHGRDALIGSCEKASKRPRLKRKQSVTGVTAARCRKTEDSVRRLRGEPPHAHRRRPAAPRGTGK